MCSSGVGVDNPRRHLVFLSIDRGGYARYLNRILSNLYDRLVADSQRCLLHHQCQWILSYASSDELTSDM